MKKSLLGLIALTGMALTSCDLAPKDSTSTITVPAFNMIMPLNGGEPIISSTPCFYTFDSNISKSTVVIKVNPLTIDNTAYSFTTESTSYQPYSTYNPDQASQSSNKVISVGNYMVGVKGTMNNSATLPIKNGTFFYNTSDVLPQISWQPKHEGLMYSGQSYPVTVIASYQLGEEYLVRTFYTDAFYAGTTHTTYPGMNGQTVGYDNNSMIYRVLIDLKQKTATVLIYKAKFSDNKNEPEKEVVSIPGLKVTFGNGYYTLAGGDITPLVYEANDLIENPSFKIKTFSMTTQGAEMINVAMNYEVEHTMKMGEGEEAREITVTYTGNFNGASATLPSVTK